MTSLIEMRGVGFEVFTPVAARILHPLDLSIEESSYTAIIGPSGAGKTTLASLVGALQPPTEGSYRFENHELAGMSPAAAARFRSSAIGFVFQQSHLMDERSAIANVALGITDPSVPRKLRLTRAAEALSMVELESLAPRPAGLLSGGERHRVALARAVVKRPRLLIADEPTAALDQITGRAILTLLTAAREQGTTVMVVSHDERVGEMADQVITVVDGRAT